MAEPWEPGVLAGKIAKVNLVGDLAVRESLAVIAREVESAAKVNLALTSHRYEEPTASRPGHPPSLVSGTLRRSITHDPVHKDGLDWVTKVGTASNFYPAYRTKGSKRRASHVETSRTPSSKYGLYLETGTTRNGAAYPFLRPAFESAYQSGLFESMMSEAFKRRW